MHIEQANRISTVHNDNALDCELSLNNYNLPVSHSTQLTAHSSQLLSYRLQATQHTAHSSQLIRGDTGVKA